MTEADTHYLYGCKDCAPDKPKETCCNHDCAQGKRCPNRRDGLDIVVGHSLSFLSGIGFIATVFLIGFWRWK